MVKDLYQTLIPADHNIQIDIDKIFGCIDKLSENQAYYSKTRGSHAAMLVDSRLTHCLLPRTLDGTMPWTRQLGDSCLEEI